MRSDRAREIGKILGVAAAMVALGGVVPRAGSAGVSPPASCVGDANGDGQVAINELVIAVNNALGGCPQPAEPLGTREFTIAAPGERTGLYTTALPVSVISQATAGPIKIVGGVPDANGVAALSIAEDANFAVRLIDASVVCFRILAAGSSGSIDCDGGSPYDVSLSAEAGAEAPPGTITTGLGSDAGPGAATLLVMTQSAQLPAASPFDGCATATFTEPSAAVYTTATATTMKGGVGPLSTTGESFDCDAFTTTDGPGMLVSPSAATDPRAGGDVVNNLRIADH